MLCGQPQKQPNNLLYAVHSEQLLIYRSLLVAEVKPNLIQGYNRSDVWDWLREKKNISNLMKYPKNLRIQGQCHNKSMTFYHTRCCFAALSINTVDRELVLHFYNPPSKSQGFKKWLPHYTVYKTCPLISGNLLSKRTPF